jgi:hypothetical protein
MLDTSASMSDSYDQVNSYTTGGFLREFLRIGDTFHFVPFSAKPKVDIARRIEGRGELEAVIGRMLLQYPLESGPDIPAALSYIEKYIQSLPARPKKIVLISGGDAAAINEAKARLASGGATIDFVKVTSGQPLANLPSSGRAALPASRPAQSPAPSSAAGASRTAGDQASGQGQMPAPASNAAAAQPRTAPQTADSAARPPQPATPPAAAAQTRTAPQTADSAAIARQNADANADTGSQSGAGGRQPGTAIPGAEQSAAVNQGEGTPPGVSTAETAGSPPVSPTGRPAAGGAPQTAPSQTPIPGAAIRPSVPQPPAQAGGFSPPLLIAIAAGGLAVLALIIFMLARRLQGSPNRAMAMAAAPHSRERQTETSVNQGKDAGYTARPQPRSAAYSGSPPAPPRSAPVVIDPNGPLLLNLFVEDQSTFIGKRNIHALKSGFSFSIGGGKSDFLIFLVPIPPAIGEVRRDGSRITFIPRKAKYFPDLGSKEVSDCIGKTIRIISDKNYELRFRLEQYEDPLIALNRLLNSVKLPG